MQQIASPLQGWEWEYLSPDLLTEIKPVEISKLCFILNGKLVEVENPDPQQLLVHYLRESGHTGTKVS